MASRAFVGAPPGLTRSLPNEHGFWVMLSASVLGGWLRAGFSRLGIAVGVAVFSAAVLVAAVSRRRIRGHEGAQLAATACLALAGAPIEMIAGMSRTGVLTGVAARLAIFVASALMVRSAFARSARHRAARSSALQRGAIGIVFVTGLCLALTHRYSEAWACGMASAVYLVLAWGRPTAKQLKPLGLTLAGLAFASAVALAL